VFKLNGRTPPFDWWFWLVPLRELVLLETLTSVTALAAIAMTILVACALGALAFRRAADANLVAWIGMAAIVPVLQIPIILLLCAMPSREAPTLPDIGRAPVSLDWMPSVQGLAAGTVITVFAVAVGALVFGTYGFGMFVLTPFLIGAATAYFGNRRGDIGWRRTAALVVAATALGSLALILVALEGAVCIVIASPLSLAAALIGAAFGRATVLRRAKSTSSTLMSIALLPISFATERALPVQTVFDTQETIEIHAPPQAVWQSLVKMDSIDLPPALPFRLGVAYPLSGEIIGQGVGAIRLGIFSTGIAIERVTVWESQRKLAFVVLSNPPAMHELSPYRHVNAPHVHGYFETISTSFEIVPLAGGNVRVVEHTAHEMKLDPVLYWLPFARLIVHENNTRVLAYIKEHAERIAATGG
jgi:hypothetical protein